jgi:hypothetical protein
MLTKVSVTLHAARSLKAYLGGLQGVVVKESDKVEDRILQHQGASMAGLVSMFPGFHISTYTMGKHRS